MKVNNHVLLPLLANWAETVETTLAWDTEIEPALRGNEQRGGLRAMPRATLNFTATLSGAAQWAALRAALIDGLRVNPLDPAETANTGRFCVPWHGRASFLALAPSAGNMLTLDASPWGWSVGDWCLLVDARERWKVAQLTAVAGQILFTNVALEGSPDIELAAFDAIYPLLFGVLQTPIEPELLSSSVSDVAITLQGDRFEIDPAAPVICPAETWAPPVEPIGPTAEFTWTIMGMAVSFDAGLSTPGDAPLVSFEWDFGDGETGVSIDPEHVYLTGGIFLVTLKVRDSAGLWATVQHPVVLADPFPYDAYGQGPLGSPPVPPGDPARPPLPPGPPMPPGPPPDVDPIPPP